MGFTCHLDGLLAFAEFVGADASIGAKVVDVDAVDVEVVPRASVGQPVASAVLDRLAIVLKPVYVRFGLGVYYARQLDVVARLRRYDRLLHRHFGFVCSKIH